jgi:hypothetical protein
MGCTLSINGNKRSVYKVLIGKLEGKRPMRELGVDEMIILRLM